MKYDLGENGEFILNIELENDRGHGVAIHSLTYPVNGLEVREVSAVGFETDSAVHADIANALLVHNARVTLGAWLLHPHQHDDGFTAIFRCPVDAVTTVQVLHTVIHAVAQAADFIEERFTGGDEF